MDRSRERDKARKDIVHSYEFEGNLKACLSEVISSCVVAGAALEGDLGELFRFLLFR